MPRVVSGRARSLQLQTPKGRDTRPTADKVKEALFSRLVARMELEGCRVLELFAGSGQLGIEALSRGAKSCLFVEQGREAQACIRQNLRHTHFEQEGELWGTTVERAISKLRAQQACFDLLLIDPPYAKVAAFFDRQASDLTALLQPGAWLVLEAEKGFFPSETVTNLTLLFSCEYGGTVLFFFQKNIV